MASSSNPSKSSSSPESSNIALMTSNPSAILTLLQYSRVACVVLVLAQYHVKILKNDLLIALLFKALLLRCHGATWKEWLLWKDISVSAIGNRPQCRDLGLVCSVLRPHQARCCHNCGARCQPARSYLIQKVDQAIAGGRGCWRHKCNN